MSFGSPAWGALANGPPAARIAARKAVSLGRERKYSSLPLGQELLVQHTRRMPAGFNKHKNGEGAKMLQSIRPHMLGHLFATATTAPVWGASAPLLSRVMARACTTAQPRSSRPAMTACKRMASVHSERLPFLPCSGATQGRKRAAGGSSLQKGGNQALRGHRTANADVRDTAVSSLCQATGMPTRFDWHCRCLATVSMCA